MDFELNEEQKILKKAAAEFGAGEFEEGKEYDRKEKFPWDVIKKAAKQGFIGVLLDEKFGGAGYTVTEKGLIIKEFAKIDPGIAQAIWSADFGAYIVQKHGGEDLKKKYLPKVTSGETVMGTAISEPDVGSDLASIRTRAVKKDGKYVIDGNKMFVTNGDVADFIIVYCRTDPDVKRGHKGLSLFIINTDDEGYQSNKLEGKLGIRASDTAEVSLSGVEVDEGKMIGEEGKGVYYVLDFLTKVNRICTAFFAVGIAEGAFEKSLDYAKEREQFGKPISEFQMIKAKLAEMKTKIDAAKLLTHRAAEESARTEGRLANLNPSIAKWYAGEVAVDVVDEALEIHGGYGYMEDYDIERFYRDAKIAEIYEGTKEIQKLMIADDILQR
ncbi:hypothetical protein AKJ39_02080 [candidate division MSBL1 archaeon SCGC-AAA259J03]|uniref:Acyl-CoA dehydrogenase n=1 Tax=candidate division MSBL1 archaeon SCGC-AAA259J03 TaxID=1698269 RepID=A0A656YWD7_9EURY|nr:hypothetical protein AKJ39_02080 [candidate division MSBL1 archaeon SCGC-AAA259J03]